MPLGLVVPVSGDNGMACLFRSPSGQLIQQVENLIEGGSVQRPHLLEAIALVQRSHLKYKCNGGRSQAVLLVRLDDQRAVEPRPDRCPTSRPSPVRPCRPDPEPRWCLSCPLLESLY